MSGVATSGEAMRAAILITVVLATGAGFAFALGAGTSVITPPRAKTTRR
jgi:hypothetical protein